ncbi:hypothetical protein IJI94_00205 [Candidatus Saccharibacteria bacterium]|nr:hypothetical protein [Candidatus Saccharibacteria bacterium]
MGILVSKDEDNSILQERINVDLRERVQRQSGEDDNEKDFAEDSEYVKQLQKTGRFSWVWFVLIILAIASLIFIFAL